MPKFVPRKRKSRDRQRDASVTGPTSSGDTNAIELLPASKTEREARRKRLRQEIREQLPKVSQKKQKRLDKYIVC